MVNGSDDGTTLQLRMASSMAKRTESFKRIVANYSIPDAAMKRINQSSILYMCSKIVYNTLCFEVVMPPYSK